MDEFLFVGLILVGDHNSALPVFTESSFNLPFYFFMIGHLLEPVDMQLIVNKVETLV